MEKFLNERLEKLEKVHEDAIANHNYKFALDIYIRIEEVKDLLYLLKNKEILKSSSKKED